MATTVSEMYDQLKYWIGEEVDALYLVNTAIRFISKRLYVLDSELVIAIMEVPVFASHTLTGVDIAFANNGATADTITQTAALFSSTGFQAGMPILGSTTNPGPFRIVTVAAGTLTLHDDDAVTTEALGSAVTLTSEDAFGYLPADFWGLWGQPYIEGKSTTLIPLPGVEAEIQFAGTGVPYYYKIRGNRIYVAPHTSTDYTIIADYFQKPATIENTTDYLPWDDLFNDIIYEIVINLFKKSGIMVPELQAIFTGAIDLIAVKRGKKAPRQFPRGIDYSNYK